MLNNCQQRLSALQKSQESLEQSTKDFSNFLVTITGQDKGKHEHLEEQVSTLTKKINDKVRTFQKASASQNHLVEDLNTELEALSMTKAAQDKMIGLFQEELNHLAQEQRNVKVPDSDIIESKVQRLKAEDIMFRQQLGVEINKIKGGFLQIVFSQINFNKPDSLYMFSLKLDENRKYIVNDCQPSIADIDDIVGRLNTDNDFSKFMHTVRCRFKDEAHKESTC